MSTERSTPSIGEVLEVLATHRARLVEQKGESWVKNHPISDDWGHISTAMALLLQNAGQWQHLLENEETRRKLYFAFQEDPIEA